MSVIPSSRCLMLLLVLVALPVVAMAQDEEKPKAKAKSKAKSADGLQGYYAIVASELQLSAEQRKQLGASLGDRNEAMKKWDAEHGAKLAELTAAEKKAKEAGDDAAAKQAGDELKKLRQSRIAIEDGGKAKLQAVLTPEQRSHLQGYNLYVGAMTRFSKAQLTDAQKVRAKAISLETGKALSLDISTKDLNKAKADLAARIEKEILTDEQRQVMSKAAAEKSPAKSKAKAPEKEKSE